MNVPNQPQGDPDNSLADPERGSGSAEKAPGEAGNSPQLVAVSQGERKARRSLDRILVALDASPESLAALEVAVELADRLEAELVGIYVEDLNLLRLAELPFVREVGFFSASLRQIESPAIERQLRAQARWMQRAVAVLAGRAQIRWSFRIVRGLIPAELLAAALDADLIIVGRTGWSGRRRLGSTARVVMLHAPGRALLLRRGVRLGLPVIVAFDGSEAGRKALAATELVWAPGSLLTVLLLADELELAQELQVEAQNWLGRHDPAARYHWSSRPDAAALARLVRAEGCGMLVLPAESDRLPEDVLVELLQQAECAVLLVR